MLYVVALQVINAKYRIILYSSESESDISVIEFMHVRQRMPMKKIFVSKCPLRAVQCWVELRIMGMRDADTDPDKILSDLNWRCPPGCEHDSVVYPLPEDVLDLSIAKDGVYKN